MLLHFYKGKFRFNMVSYFIMKSKVLHVIITLPYACIKNQLVEYIITYSTRLTEDHNYNYMYLFIYSTTGLGVHGHEWS